MLFVKSKSGVYPPHATTLLYVITLRWHHNGRDSVSNHQPHDSLHNRLFRRRSKKTSKLGVTDLFAGNSSGTGVFPAQMASNAENASIWWRHHDVIMTPDCKLGWNDDSEYSIKMIGNISQQNWWKQNILQKNKISYDSLKQKNYPITAVLGWQTLQQADDLPLHNSPVQLRDKDKCILLINFNLFHTIYPHVYSKIQKHKHCHCVVKIGIVCVLCP